MPLVLQGWEYYCVTADDIKEPTFKFEQQDTYHDNEIEFNKKDNQNLHLFGWWWHPAADHLEYSISELLECRGEEDDPN